MERQEEGTIFSVLLEPLARLVDDGPFPVKYSRTRGILQGTSQDAEGTF